MTEHQAFVLEALRIFPGSHVSHEVTFEAWFRWLRDELKAAIFPALKISCPCSGGCQRCGGTGLAPIGWSNKESDRLEAALRLMTNGRSACPVERLPWWDLAFDVFTARLEKVRQ